VGNTGAGKSTLIQSFFYSHQKIMDGDGKIKLRIKDEDKILKIH
jgi:AAA15 family ATPase/GTPase